MINMYFTVHDHKNVFVSQLNYLFDLKARSSQTFIHRLMLTLTLILKRTYYMNDPRDQLFRNQNKYFAIQILRRSRQNFVLVCFFVNKYVYCWHNMPVKRRLVTSKVYFGSEIAGLL